MSSIILDAYRRAVDNWVNKRSESVRQLKELYRLDDVQPDVRPRPYREYESLGHRGVSVVWDESGKYAEVWQEGIEAGDFIRVYNIHIDYDMAVKLIEFIERKQADVS